MQLKTATLPPITPCGRSRVSQIAKLRGSTLQRNCVAEKWPKTASGLPSTAGTTASIAFIRRGKIYIGHVGDSGIILGYQEPGSPEWKALPLTRDHKPENADELLRIEQCGGKVIAKSG